MAEITLESLLVSKNGFGLTTATPLQRAICRMADGIALGDLADDPDVIESVGNVSTLPVGKRPFQVDIIASIRSAKTLIAVAAAVRAALTCDVSIIREAGEMPRIPLVSLNMDLAEVAYNHLIGTLQISPFLKNLIIDTPTKDSVLLRHPTGKPIEIKVAAGSKAGGTLVSRWMASIIFDEYARMSGSGDGVINYDDMIAAVRGRILKGGQIFSISSPWAPMGPAYNRFRKHWGYPTQEIVIIKANGRAMNPYYWTEEKIQEIKEADYNVYRTDVLAEFADQSSTFFSSVSMDACTRRAPLIIPYSPQNTYVAAMDPATRANAWTLVVSTLEQGVKKVVYHQQWIGKKSEPLRPDDVLRQIGQILMSYQIDTVYSDQYSADALKSIAEVYNFRILCEHITSQNKLEMFDNLRTLMLEGLLELPNDSVFLADLKQIRKKITQNSISIYLPKSGDGRHCDYAAAVALCISKHIDDAKPVGPVKGSKEWLMQEAARMKQRRMDEMRNKMKEQEHDWLDRELHELEGEHDY